MESLLEPQVVFKAQENWRNDPVECSKTFFNSRLWSKQEEVMLAVRDYPKVAVKSGNTVGKSRIASEIALTFLLSYYPSKVIITAPTFTQVEEILWKEIAGLYYKSSVPIGGDLLNTELKLNEQWFALGISTNDINRFQGFHSPYLLVIVDEALGIAPEIWEAIEGLHPYRVLAIGNPLQPTGKFFDCFSNELWHKITISCLECIEWQKRNERIPGLVTQQWVDERREEWGISSPLYQSRVLGEFPQEGTDTLVHLDWMDKCRVAEIEEEDDALKIVSTDVARFGDDKTVFIDRRGHTLDTIEIKEKIPTTQTAGIIKKHYQDYEADNLVVDDTGVGGGVTDIISEQKIGVIPFNGGSRQKAIDKNHFTNLRSQFYWYTAKKLEKGVYSFKKISPYLFEKLKNQMCAIKYTIDSSGRIKVESKEDMRARGLPSPDIADAFMQSEYAYFVGRMGEVRPYLYRS